MEALDQIKRKWGSLPNPKWLFLLGVTVLLWLNYLAWRSVDCHSHLLGHCSGFAMARGQRRDRPLLTREVARWSWPVLVWLLARGVRKSTAAILATTRSRLIHFVGG